MGLSHSCIMKTRRSCHCGQGSATHSGGRLVTPPQSRLRTCARLDGAVGGWRGASSRRRLVRRLAASFLVHHHRRIIIASTHSALPAFLPPRPPCSYNPQASMASALSPTTQGASLRWPSSRRMCGSARTPSTRMARHSGRLASVKIAIRVMWAGSHDCEISASLESEKKITINN